MGGPKDTSRSSQATKLRKGLSAIVVWRVGFIGFLLALSALFGFVAYISLTGSEKELADSQYESIADRALFNSRNNILRKAKGSNSLAKMIGTVSPDAAAWPYVGVDNFESITNDIVDPDSGGNLFSPIVAVHQQAAFETFAYEYYESRGYPNGTGVSSIGEGIWVDKGFIEAANGSTLLGNSPYEGEIIVPVFLHSDSVYPLLMIDLHFYPALGNGMDRIITCVEDKLNSSSTANLENSCGDVSEVVQFRFTFDGPSRPGTYVQMPIFPFNNQSTVSNLSSCRARV